MILKISKNLILEIKYLWITEIITKNLTKMTTKV